jgi:hypothetical protein
MLEFLRDSASPRKCRLFACAVGRLLPRLSLRAENLAEELARVLPCSSGWGMGTVELPDAFEAGEFCASEDQLTEKRKAGLLR